MEQDPPAATGGTVFSIGAGSRNFTIPHQRTGPATLRRAGPFRMLVLLRGVEPPTY